MKITLIVIAALVLAVLIGGGMWLWTPDRPRAVLEARYLDAPGDMVEVLGERLHVRDSGPKDAPAVIMIHGFGSSLHTWEAWAQGLQDRFRAIRLDLPGSGLSEPDPTGDYTDARTLALLIALMDRLGVAKASFIGNSIGGRIAWRFAAAHPERTDKLVLVSPDGFASAGFAYGEKPAVSVMAQAMRFVLPRSLVLKSLAPAYGDPSRLTAATADRYYDLLLAPGSRGAMIARMEQTVLVEPEPVLRTIRAPVLLLWGDRDVLIPIRNAADYLKALPDARLVTLPGLGHVPQEEAPEVSLPPVKAFLGS